MAYYIIIRGALGIGKTELSKRLSKILRAKHISMDSLLRKMGLDRISKNAGCIPAENFIKADNKIFPEAKKLLAKGRIIIFDGCFYHKKQIMHIIKNLKFKHYVFTLKAPLRVCMARDSKRIKVYGKSAAEAVFKLVSRFDYGTIVNTNKKKISQTIKRILSYLN